MLPSPSHAVVGAVDPDRIAGFVQLFGFECAAEGTLPAEAARELYGLDGATRELVLSVPGAERGWLRIVRTPNAPRQAGPFDHRPLAIDLYSRDIQRSLEIARTYDIQCHELVEYTVGPYEVKAFEAIGPERFKLNFIQANILTPCVLKADPDRLHSELHSLVWAVASAAETLPPWKESAGLEALVDTHFGGPIISKLMGLPKPEMASISSMVPSATISPPCSPAPGPMSMMWSADRIVSSSCSTTIIVFPRSRSLSSVLMRRLLSR